MAADQLQQLRDIHLPEPPGWWPPAPGWWLLAGLAVAALWWAFVRLRARRRRSAPLRFGRAAYAEVFRRYRHGELDYREYLDETDELIKRVLIHGLGDDRARRATGEAWLAHLDGYLGDGGFSRGPGRVLGDERFRPQPGGDPAALHQLVTRLLKSLTVPPPGRRRSRRNPATAGASPGTASGAGPEGTA